MQCPQCHHENRDIARFCEACSNRLELACPSCGNLTGPGAIFCDHCGTRLREQALTPTDNQQGKILQVQPLSDQHGAAEAERRQLTVMFCDLVGSTALSEQLDPEDLREVIRTYQEVCVEVIQRFEGHITRYLGDGLLVYFGYPLAHEDDAQRAVRTGLGIVEEMKKLNTRLQQDRDVQLAVRIGIHTGLVVVGEMGGGAKREQLALGETPNIAARIQGLAEPDTVVISPSTYRLVQGYFNSQSLGAHSLKGISRPMEVYRVEEESEAQGRLEVAIRRGLTPLVGREQEMGLLQSRWEQVKRGTGQVVMVSGEAGIGKSRLVQVIKEQVGREGYRRIEYRCSPYHQHSALYPVMTHLQRVFQFTQGDTPEEKLNKLERVLLGRTQVEETVEGVTGGKSLPWEVVEQVIVKTDGVPLFVEELVKMVLESGLVREREDHYELIGPLAR